MIDDFQMSQLLCYSRLNVNWRIHLSQLTLHVMNEVWC